MSWLKEFREFAVKGNVVDFVIIALVIFLMVKAINHLRRKSEQEPPAAPPPRDVQLLEEIRDLLKQRK